MNKGLFSLIGFSLFLIGMLALVLSLVGVKLSFLSWIDDGGRGLGLLIRLAMVIIGAVIVVVTRSNFDGREGVDY